jgi:hypothetical protein
MKQIIVLAFFGLFIQTAFGQILEINSPSEDDLYCALTSAPSDNEDNLIIYIFGKNGTGFLSSDKCATWHELEVDPKEKRTIFSAIRVNDTLLIVSGDGHNDLLKYSLDGGSTFYDFDFLEDRYISGVTFFNDYVIFSHKKSLTYWNIKSGEIREREVLSADYDTEIINLSGNNFLVNLGIKKVVEGIPKFSLMINKNFPQDGLWQEFDYDYDLITSWSTRGNYILASALKQQEGTTYEVVKSPYFQNLEWGVINGLEYGDVIKSSHVSLFSSFYWHVGGNKNNQDGIVIKEGEVVKRVKNGRLNGIYHCGYYDQKGYSNLIDDIIIVGDNGRILSSRLDLALAKNNDLCNDYVVSDTVVYAGDEAIIHVSGSDIGVSYQVFTPGEIEPIFEFVGDGSPWLFSVPVICSSTFYVSASKDGQNIILTDMAEVETITRQDYEVSDVTSMLGDRVVITISGSQKGLEYCLTSGNGKNIGMKPQIGTGEPISFFINLNSGLFFEGINRLSVSVRGCGFTKLLDDKSVISIKAANRLSIERTYGLMVFPNPCKNQLTVISAQNSIAYLVNISGKVLNSIKLEPGNNELDVSSLQSGIYFVRIGSEVIKIVKQ